MPAILFVVLGVGAVALLMSKSSGQAPAPPQGPGLPPVLPGQAPGTSFGPQPVQSFGPHPSPLLGSIAFLGNPGVISSHDVAPIPVPPQVVGPGLPPPPTPVPVQVPGVQHVMVATHDTGPSGNLAIHSAPSTSAGVLTEAPHMSVLAVTGPNVDDPALPGGWSPVLQESSGIHGFSATMYLKAM